MSITFTITNTPYVVTDTYECQCVDFDTNQPWAKCMYCQGTGKVSYEEPSWLWTNMANTNAMNVLQAIGMPSDYDGCWEGASLDSAIQGCLRALNSEARRSVATRDAYSLPGGHAGVRVIHEGNVARVERMGAPVIGCGYSDERVQMRVREILAICKKAKAEGEKVTWG